MIDSLFFCGTISPNTEIILGRIHNESIESTKEIQ